MIKNKRQWMYLAVLILTGLFMLFHGGLMISQAQEGEVLRVAFPELEGMSEINQYGSPTGIVVDYLNEIAKYTGWEYEYIEVGNEDLIANFKEGKYDLMGGSFYSPEFEQYFAYPDYNMGRSRAVLFCRQEDDSLLGYDLTSLNGKTIGVYKNAVDKIRYLMEFLANNDLKCQIQYYSYEDMEDGNLYRRLREGEVDMLLGNDMEINSEFRMVTSFQAQPYYIVTTVDNREVLEELNTALHYILESRPSFADETYYANFPDVRMTDIQLNDKEQRYIEKKGTVTIAVPANWHPFYCRDNAPELHEGMLPELLRKISDFTGLQFTYVYGDSYNECLQLVQQGKADLLGGLFGRK